MILSAFSIAEAGKALSFAAILQVGRPALFGRKGRDGQRKLLRQSAGERRAENLTELAKNRYRSI
jgi:hypothetical protein